MNLQDKKVKNDDEEDKGKPDEDEVWSKEAPPSEEVTRSVVLCNGSMAIIAFYLDSKFEFPFIFLLF